MRSIETLKSGRYKVRFRYGAKQTSETFDRLSWDLQACSTAGQDMFLNFLV